MYMYVCSCDPDAVVCRDWNVMFLYYKFSITIVQYKRVKIVNIVIDLLMYSYCILVHMYVHCEYSHMHAHRI